MKILLALAAVVAIAGCRQNPSDPTANTDILEFNICNLRVGFSLYVDYEHNVCWVRENSGNGSTSFSVPCDTVKACKH